MSTSRESILKRIKNATTALPAPTQHPHYHPSLVVSHNGNAALASDDLVDSFARQWQSNKGKWAIDWTALADYLKAMKPTLGFCSPVFEKEFLQAWPDAPISTQFDRSKVDAFAFGITPAWGAIAETGTVILTDKTSPSRLGALAPWTHIAVIPKDNIFPTLARAIEALPDDPSIILVTGPSKTADIEGILIEGVHGPGIQYALAN